VAGWRAGLVVLLGDLAKGLLPTLVALVALGRGAALGCWLAATLGHVFPVTRRFRGGKGVATAGGGALVVLPLASVVLIVLFVIIVKVRHTASIGSITMAAGLPVGALATGRPAREVIVAALVGALVIARHADNIRRLVRHEEQLFTPR
jgi:glycerol-3-phosphate acyltransferase PlsY